MSCYLDNAATHPLNDEVKKYIIDILDIFGNPSSMHSFGQQAREIVEESRRTVAHFIKADVDDITFTSSGSASNVLGIKGFSEKNDCTIIYSPTLHKSALKTIKHLSYIQKQKVVELKIDKYGKINERFLERVLTSCKNTPFIVIDYANSEIGTVQDVNTISLITHKHKGVIFVDCTGSISTIPIDVIKDNIDIVTFSGHKIGSLKGVGVLYKNKKIDIQPLIFGSQENGLFAGTENVVGIASLKKAIDIYDYKKINSHSRDYVWNFIKTHINQTFLVGETDMNKRLKNNLYVCFKGVDGAQLVALLDTYHISVSTGSACNNGDVVNSYVLEKIGMNIDVINSCVRFSFGFNDKETISEMRYICNSLLKCVNSLRNY